MHLDSIHVYPLTSASHSGQSTMPQMTPIRNPPNEVKPSVPPLSNQFQMPLMTPIFARTTEQAITLTSTKTPMTQNRPSLPSPIGKPPPHVHSQAQKITPQPQLEYGKLVIRILNGINLKGGQDPYVRIKLGNSEATTNPHMDGGRNPVSD